MATNNRCQAKGHVGEKQELTEPGHQPGLPKDLKPDDLITTPLR